MAETKNFDLVVIGAGPGGYVAAIRAAQLGMNTALIDREHALGGTCLRIGCIPSKALLESSELYARSADLGNHGIRIASAKLDLGTMMERKTRVVTQLTDGIGRLMKMNKVTVLSGTARFTGPRMLEVEGEDAGAVTARHIVIATGSEPQQLPFLPFDGERIVGSEEALSFPEVPKRLLVVGAGAIGLELGSVWARLGSKVTVIEILPQVLAGWDDEVARTVGRELKKQGIGLELATRVESFRKTKTGVTLKATPQAGGEARSYQGDRVLVAVGRRPYTDGLGLESAGVAMEDDGQRIRVDDRFRTNVDGVYAIGDVIRGPMLAHKAEDEGAAMVERIAGVAGHVNYDVIPNVVYTHPEVASVGKTEEQLKEAGTDYRKGSFRFVANGRALAMADATGFVKLLADARTDRLLGAHIVGPQASTMIAEAVAVMEFAGSAEDLARTVHAHPTLPEAIREAALAVDGRAIHSK